MQINSVGVYWKARRESAAQCSARLARFLVELADQFPMLADWYKKGQRAALEATAISVRQLSSKDILALVSASSNKRDIGGEPIAELGFGIGLWNGKTGDAEAGVGITCGLDSANPGLINSVVLKLPKDLKSIGLGSDNGQRKLLLLLAVVWDAEWGAVYSSRSEVFKQRRGGGPFLDKMLWLRDGQQVPITADEVSATEKCVDGTLYVQQHSERDAGAGI
jgi:hypothetical protein